MKILKKIFKIITILIFIYIFIISIFYMGLMIFLYFNDPRINTFRQNDCIIKQEEKCTINFWKFKRESFDLKIIENKFGYRCTKNDFGFNCIKK